MKRILVIAALSLPLFGGWSCQHGYTGNPGPDGYGHSGQPPAQQCRTEQYPSPCQGGEPSP